MTGVKCRRSDLGASSSDDKPNTGVPVYAEILNDRKVIVSFSRFLYNIHQILYYVFATENGLDLHKIKGPITLEFDFV